jgi:hypothetical protein
VTLRVLAGDFRKDRRNFDSAFAGFAALGVLLALPGIACAEEPTAADAAPMSATATAHPANPPPQATVRGIDPVLLEALGRWMDWSMEDFNTRMKAAHGRFVAIGAAGRSAVDSPAKEFTDSFPRQPAARVVAGHERCEVGANGAPDCATAVETMCRTGGFSTGRSLDTQAVQKCPARIWLSGQVPQLGECQTEAFVSRALCQ